jgi:hypothetical protein
VRLQQEDGRIVDGQGSDLDTIVSAARAYVHALNKLQAQRAPDWEALRTPIEQPEARARA